MNIELLKVGLRQKALYLPAPLPGKRELLSVATLSLCNELRQIGFALSEDALVAVNALDDDGRKDLLDTINEVMGTHLNWASLVRGWLTPTGESSWDHFVTLMANLLRSSGQGDGLSGTTLPCGHFIPDGTFPLERYTGCPFCGKPFVTDTTVFRGQGSKLRLLQLWGDKEMKAFSVSLLSSPVTLDATQRASLTTLLQSQEFGSQLTVHHAQVEVDGVPLTMTKETMMLVIDALVTARRDDEAGGLFTSPADVLRYLWYRHTGYVQVLKPRTIINSTRKNQHHERSTAAGIDGTVADRKQKLKLKYDRQWCRRVAQWLNAPLTSHPSPLASYLEQMHPNRGMWVRFVRALRLAEYARKPGFEGLAMLLDRFYRGDYTVWQGQVDACRARNDAATMLPLLQQRPGLFARCLFSTMLAYGPDNVLPCFAKVTDRLPLRLLLTLGYQAQLYFDRKAQRVARPLTGLAKLLPPHPLLAHYTDAQLNDMSKAVNRLFLQVVRKHYASQPSPLTSHPSVYIDPQLFNIPIAVGDRSATVQDVSAALQGTRFAVQGDHVRLFLQWGKGLPAQYMDMDLSCQILLRPGDKGHTLDDGSKQKYITECSYFNLSVRGAKHSGDIREIPDEVGTAEYIELSLPELQSVGAQRVVFTCNAYSKGALQPGLMVGWMSAEQPMTVDEKTGVAYDPSTVDHIVRITETNLSKGLIFGVLDVERREITWLEMPFDGQTVFGISPETVDAYLRRLQAKPTIGQLLSIRAETQGMTLVHRAEDADECYDMLWAQDAARVSRLLLA